MSARAPLTLLALVAFVATADGETPPGAHARSLAATCANCHGTDGVSAGGLPSLAGMRREDLLRAMIEFRRGTRPATVMQQLAKGYTEEDLAAIAQWFASEPHR